MPNRPPREWFERQVRAIERHAGAVDARAVVGARWRDLSGSERARIVREEESGAMAKTKKGKKKGKGRRDSKGRTPAQRAATKKMIAANRARRGGGSSKTSKGKGKRKSGKRGGLEKRVSHLEHGMKAQAAFNHKVVHSIAHIHKAAGISAGPRLFAPKALLGK